MKVLQRYTRVPVVLELMVGFFRCRIVLVFDVRVCIRPFVSFRESSVSRSQWPLTTNGLRVPFFVIL